MVSVSMLRSIMQIMERPSYPALVNKDNENDNFFPLEMLEMEPTLLSPPSYTARAVTKDSVLLKAFRSIKS